MNFTQLQERVRLEVLRRIERGTLSVSLLARQAGLGQPHVSNFLRGRRGLSLAALDRILAAQRIVLEDLLPSRRVGLEGLLDGQTGEVVRVPLVSASAAMFEPYVMRASTVQMMVPLPADLLLGLRVRGTPGRKQWDRFVAVRLSAEDAPAMEPLLGAGAMLVLDRHSNVLRGETQEATIFAVRAGERLRVRFADYQAGRVIMRPMGLGFAVEVIEPGNGETANDLVVGRVVVVVRGYR